MGMKEITRGTQIGFVILAIGSGAVGGGIHSALVHTAAAQVDSPRVIRATAVELVNTFGERVGFLGTDEGRNVALVFFDARGTKRAEFGLRGGENPRLDINGPEGSSLLSLDLGQRSKPRLMMSDHDFDGRVYLGVVEPDAPSPAWKYDSWVLRFTGDHTKALAIIGMTARGAGGVAVFDQAGRRWRTPLE